MQNGTATRSKVADTMAPMSKRAQMAEVRREAVLEATAALLDEVGVSSLTIRQVAERAGVAQGSVFLYAESKADLVNQVYGLRIAEHWHTLLDSLADERPLDRVEAFYLGCVDAFYDDLDNVMAFYQTMANSIGTGLPMVDKLNARIHAILVEAEQAGDLRAGVDVDVLEYSYEGLYANVIRLSGAGKSREETRRIIGASMTQLRDGISA